MNPKSVRPVSVGPCLVVFFCGLTSWVSAQTTRPSKFPKAEIKPYHGAPTLFINGEPNAGLTYMTYKPEAKYYGDFGKIGVDLASLSVTADFSMYGRGEAAVWLAPGKYDYHDIDQKMQLILQANPNAWVLPRVYLCSPPWWDKEHPGELVQYDNGKTERPVARKMTIPSWASEEYRKASADNLRLFIEHVRQQPYADRVIGYHIASGDTDEWFYWDTDDDFQDYSAPMVNAFRKWLEQKYPDNGALQKAWNKPDVTLATAAIPTKGQRLAMDLFTWRDPAARQNVIDYYTFYCENDIGMIKLLARTVKEATNGQQICGVFYGYLLHGSSHNLLQNTGHLALHELLQCPDLDFITAPTSYAFRDLGTGYSAPQLPTDAVRLHGKYFFDENDYRTHLLPWKAGDNRETANLQESEAMQMRQMGTTAAHGWGAWWFDMGGGWYDEPQFMDVIRKLNEVGEKSIQFDRTSTAEVAVVVDERSVLYSGLKNTVLKPLIYEQILDLGKMGATYDWVFLDDLDKARPYKFYIFLNAFHVDEAQKAAISRLRGRGAKAILWLYGAGFAGDTALDVKGCTDLTGITMKMEKKASPVYVRITPEGSGLLPSVQSDMVYGTSNYFGPILYASDPDADVLGMLEGYGVPGLVLKTVNGLDVYYSIAPKLPSALLRGMASRAGVHIYNYRDDGIYASPSLLCIHTASAGVRHIRLPERTDVYDAYSNTLVAKDAVRFDVDLPARKTVLYFLGNEAEWKKAK